MRTSHPILRVESGAVRGAAIAGGYEFLGLPYAAPPTGKGGGGANGLAG